MKKFDEKFVINALSVENVLREEGFLNEFSSVVEATLENGKLNVEVEYLDIEPGEYEQYREDTAPYALDYTDWVQSRSRREWPQLSRALRRKILRAL